MIKLIANEDKWREEHKRVLKRLNEEKKAGTIHKQLACNAVNLFKKMDNYSDNYKATLKVLAQGMPQKTAAKVFGVSETKVSKAVNLPSASLEILSARNRTLVRASRVDVVIIRQFWLEICIHPSGSKWYIRERIYVGKIFHYGERRVPVHIQTRTNWDLYLEFTAQNGLEICSYSAFVRHKPYNVRIGRLPTKANLLGDCPHCDIVQKLLQKQKNEILTPQEQRLLEKELLHQECNKKQTKFYLDLKEEVKLDPNTVFVIHDFAKIYHLGKRCNDLMISVLTYDPRRKKIVWIYLDFFEEGRGGKQDYYFVRSIWRYLLGVGELNFRYKTNSTQLDPRTLFRGKKVIIFSDGAGQHFKQKKTVSFWVELQRECGVSIEIHFFVSYHGHNVCDAHASHVKLGILYWIRKYGLSNTGYEELTNAVSKIKNTHVFLLNEDTIERTSIPALSTLIDKKLVGIKSFHRFHFKSDNGEDFLECYKLSTDLTPANIIPIPSQEEISQEEIRILEQRASIQDQNQQPQLAQSIQPEPLPQEPTFHQGLPRTPRQQPTAEEEDRDVEDGENIPTESSEEMNQDEEDHFPENGTFAARRLDLEELNQQEEEIEKIKQIEDINADESDLFPPIEGKKISHLGKDFTFY